MSNTNEEIKQEAQDNFFTTNEEDFDSSSDTDTTNDTIAKLKGELDIANERYIRMLSEFENSKRRHAKERIELFKTASKDLLVEMLPVLDNFERGMEAMEKSTDVDALKEGVRLIYHQFKGILTAQGLQAIDSLNEPFNVDLHEAISQIPATNEVQKNKVLAEVEKGYTLNDVVIRYAKVLVGV